MKLIVVFASLLFSHTLLWSQKSDTSTPITGRFIDDYGITYTISDTLWTQLPQNKYRILKWDVQQQYIIAINDTVNKTDKGMYTRIDYLYFSNTAPYTWGFCLTAYNKANLEDAENTNTADRKHPKVGCNGYPFSRMKTHKAD